MDPSLSPEFTALEERLAELKNRHARGELDDASYQQQVQQLTCASAGQSWWLGGEAGAWRRWDGTAWVPDDPSRFGASSAGRRARRLPRPLLLGCGGGLLLALAAGAVLLLGGLAEYRASPKIVEGIEPGSAAAEAYALSPVQQQVRAELGAPQAFTLLFYEEQLEDGSLGDVRLETWSYYTDGVEYTFINGEQVAREALELDLGGEIIAIPYRPEQFAAYMSLQEVIDNAGLTTYLVVPLEKELVPGGEVYYADELTFGLKEDELLYLEALALQVEG